VCRVVAPFIHCAQGEVHTSFALTLTAQMATRDDSPFMGKCRSVASFKITHRIGEGTYGTVCEYDDACC
jgi:hypothetical protein